MRDRKMKSERCFGRARGWGVDPPMSRAVMAHACPLAPSQFSLAHQSGAPGLLPAFKLTGSPI